MNFLLQNISDVINKKIEKYNVIIANKYNLSQKDLMDIWLKMDEDTPKDTPKDTFVPKDVKLPENPWDLLDPKKLHDKKQDSPQDSPETTTTSQRDSQRDSPETTPRVTKMLCQTCPYVFTKGNSVGKQCGCRVAKDNTYCSKHKKYEGVEPKEKTVVPKPKKLVSPQVKKSPEVKPVDIVLRKHKVLEQLWHSETGMVFKSANEPYVIGKCVKDKLTDLSIEDIKICKSYGFAIQEPIKIDNKDAVEIKQEVSKTIDVDYHPKVATILDKIQKAKNKDPDSDIESEDEEDEDGGDEETKDKDPREKQTNTKKFNPVSKSFDDDCGDDLEEDLFGSDEEFLEEEDEED